MEFVRGNATSENGEVISNSASDVKTGDQNKEATVHDVTDTSYASLKNKESEQDIQHPYEILSYDSH